jgi:hypothetical protein
VGAGRRPGHADAVKRARGVHSALSRTPRTLFTYASFAALLSAASADALCAQAHPGGQWSTLETPHFRVHVRPEQESLGVRTAAEAEAAFAALAARLAAPTARIDLVVSDNLDVANGFTTVFPSPVIVLYPYPPVADLALQRYDRWLRLLVTHELAHVFHLDLARGWWRVGRAVFGRAPALFPNALLPTWFTEGLAVHYETRLTGGGRADGSYQAAVVDAQAAEAGALGIDAANAASPRWPGGYRPYAFGGAFFAWLTARHGDSVMERLVRETATAPLPYLMLSRGLRRAAGLSFGAAWREWQSALVTNAAVQDSGDARGGTMTEGGTSLRRYAGTPELRGLRDPVAPRVSPDGRRVLFVLDDGRDAARIAVLDRTTGAVATLARIDGGLGLAWDTGGAVLAAEYEFTDPYTLRADLFRVGAGGRERRLTVGARLTAPDVGADGAVIAVRTDAGRSALVRWTAGQTRVLEPARPDVDWAGPRLAPDGRTIAATMAHDGNLDVVLLPRDGGPARSVTSDAGLDQAPAFSPDGTWLFWASDRGGRSQLFATRTAAPGAAWWRVTDEPFGAYAPAPALDSVFFLAYHADGFRLTAAPLDSARWTRVDPDAGSGTAMPSADAPRPARAPADSADPVLARHAYRPWPALLPKYWLPVGVAQAGGGWAGAYTSGQDALGRHAFSAQAGVGLGSAAGTWRADVAYQYAGLAPAVFDAAYTRTAGTADASIGVALRHRRYRWSAAARVAAEYEREPGRSWAGGVATAAAAHLVAPAFAISAQEGWRASANVRARYRLDGPGGHTESQVHATAFLPLGLVGFARQVLALDAAVGALTGSDTVFLGAGGVSGGAVPLLPGIAIGSSARSFPVRGFAPDAGVGRFAFAATLEDRVPLALVGRGFGLVPGALDRLSLALFVYIAQTWSPPSWTARFRGLPASRTLVSAGAELVADLGVLYDYPVRLRAGAACRVRGAAGTGGFLAVGAAF